MANMPEKLANVASGGDRLAALQVLRDRLAREIDTCLYTRDLPALVLRFTDVLAQIDEMPQSSGGGAADVIAERRRARPGRGRLAQPWE